MTRRYDDPHCTPTIEEMDISDDEGDCPFDDAVFDWSPDDAVRFAPDEVDA